jgi:hypothetical protein
MQTLETTRFTSKIVERCFLMNFNRREDRLKEWLQQLPDPWPFPQPERFAAIDGRRCATPPQWKAGNGAWAVTVTIGRFIGRVFESVEE